MGVTFVGEVAVGIDEGLLDDVTVGVELELRLLHERWLVAGAEHEEHANVFAEGGARCPCGSDGLAAMAMLDG